MTLRERSGTCISNKTKQVEWRDFERAIDTLERFNLLLVMDFVDDEIWALEKALGWKESRVQVRDCVCLDALVVWFCTW